MKKSKFLCAVIFTALTASIWGQNSENLNPKFKGWKKAETEHFNFIYEDSSKEAAENFAKIADEAWNKIGGIYSFPQDKTNIFVTGRTNTVNAFTYFAPPEIVMFNTPVSTPDFTFRADWMNLFFTHELIHVANVTHEDKHTILPKLIGNFAYNLDFIDINGWALEGLTTVLETELTPGGRGRSPYFELCYKAPTLDNSFISYNEIGMEAEPPYGQSYVMGYLIMRSIADRWGIEALSDIERNRPVLGNWEESVKLVTGESASDIYRDVKIALAKKYADERKIPEGLTISPRTNRTNYYNPAVVLDDGSLITLRSQPGLPTAAVLLDPCGIDGSKFLINEDYEDLEKVCKETVLFHGYFTDSTDFTADKYKNIYAILAEEHNDSQPGYSMETNLYSWNSDDGLTQLTKGITLSQPTVSRDGSRLIAVQQVGLRLRLVQVDTETGSITPILEDCNLDFIQPALNKDGTKLAFLILDKQRARVGYKNLKDDSFCTKTTTNGQKYKILANDDETIFDPSYPVWGENDNLTFACNYYGRLESYELQGNGQNIFNYDQTDDIKPVSAVADPAGVLWAYKNSTGIYYSTFSSSGYVIKIKPADQWYKTPNWPGPSLAGEVIHFGDLERDFPDFKPFEPYADPVKIKHRSEENIQRAKEIADKKENITTLQNEKNYHSTIVPMLYLPFVNLFLNQIEDKVDLGFGAFFLGTTPRLQMNSGLFYADAFYYPTINNFTATLGGIIPVGHSTFSFLAYRYLSTPKNTDGFRFKESNCATVKYALPFIKKASYGSFTNLTMITTISANYIRYADKLNFVAGINDQMQSQLSFTGQTGIELYQHKENILGKGYSVKGALYGQGYYDFNLNHLYFGAESMIDFARCTKGSDYGFYIKGRYTPYPTDVIPFSTLTKYAGQQQNCTSPLIFVPGLYLSFTDFSGLGDYLKTYSEFKINQPLETDALKLIPEDIVIGVEYGVGNGLEDISLGYSWTYNISSKDFQNNEFYVNINFSGFHY